MKPISAAICSINTLIDITKGRSGPIDKIQKYVEFDLKFPDAQKKLTIVFDKVNPKNAADGKGPHCGIPSEYEIEGEGFKDWNENECLWQAALLVAVQDKLKNDAYSGKAEEVVYELKEEGGNYVFIPSLSAPDATKPNQHPWIKSVHGEPTSVRKSPDNEKEISPRIEIENSLDKGEKITPFISAEKNPDNEKQLLTPDVVAQRTEELKLVTEKLGLFQAKSKEFLMKAKEEKNKDKKLAYTQAAEAIEKISKELHLLMFCYTSGTIKDLTSLKIKTKTMLKTDDAAKHIAVLESHRGIKQALTDLLTAIVTLGASLGHGLLTGNYSLFKVNTDSSNKLKKMSEVIDSLDSPNLSNK